MNDLQLQKVNAQSRNGRGMADSFGKDFGGMAQGCNKTGQKGTNAMFVMNHDEIRHALKANKFFTYANPVVDYRPQKEDPHRI